MADRWAEIKSIFLVALKSGRDERNAFLDEACQGDESLRHEVEQLLTSHEGAGSFLELPAHAPSTILESALVAVAALSAGGRRAVVRGADQAGVGS